VDEEFARECGESEVEQRLKNKLFLDLIDVLSHINDVKFKGIMALLIGIGVIFGHCCVAQEAFVKAPCPCCCQNESKAPAMPSPMVNCQCDGKVPAQISFLKLTVPPAVVLPPYFCDIPSFSLISRKSSEEFTLTAPPGSPPVYLSLHQFLI